MIQKLKISAKKVVTIPNGVDETKLSALCKEEKAVLREKWNIPQENYVVAMHSRIECVKNHLLLVEALSQLTEEERAKLTIICSGEKKGAYYEQVVSAVKQCGFMDMFRFVGWCDTRSVVGIADILVAPSLNEGFMLSAVEAFIMKVPVARTRTAGFEEQKYCIPIDAHNANDIATLLKQLCANGKMQHLERVEKAYSFAMQEFTAQAMAQKTVDIYKEVCTG